MSTNHKSFLILAVIVSVLNGKWAQNIYNGLCYNTYEMYYSLVSTAIRDLYRNFGEFIKCARINFKLFEWTNFLKRKQNFCLINVHIIY